jgi:hypothetical protein
VNLKLSCRCSPSIASSELGWKPDPCRNWLYSVLAENDLRATLRNFGLKVGMIGTVKFETRIRELVENLPDLAVLVEPLLIVRRVVREQFGILHRRLLAIVRDDDVCRRLMVFSTSSLIRVSILRGLLRPLARGGELDVLVNNAGAMYTGGQGSE